MISLDHLPNDFEVEGFKGDNLVKAFNAGIVSPEEIRDALKAHKQGQTKEDTSLSIDSHVTVKQPLPSSTQKTDVHINVSARVNRGLYKQWREAMGSISLSSYLTLKMKEDIK